MGDLFITFATFGFVIDAILVNTDLTICSLFSFRFIATHGITNSIAVKEYCRLQLIATEQNSFLSFTA